MKKLFGLLLLLSSFVFGQAALISPVPKLQFFAQNGTTPLGNGCIFTYQTGTTTPLSTFTDYTGTTLNTNPVILSAGGFASIWLQPGTSYRFAVYSNGGTNCASGALQYTTDGVAGSQGTTTTVVPYSSTPAFNITSQIQLFTLTLTGNAAALPITATGIQTPALIGLQITEDNVGLHAFTAPANVTGGMIINIQPNQTTTQWFAWNGTTASAIGPMQNGPGFVLTGINSPFAGAGTVRMGAGDKICWRSNANSYDECLALSPTDGIYEAKTTGNVNPGTVQWSLAKLAGPGVTVATTSDTSGVLGITVGNPGGTGTSSTTQTFGQSQCNFDGAVTAGDYVQISSTVGGDCHDAGATYPTSGQVIGRVNANAGGSGLYSLFLFPPEIQGFGRPVFYAQNGTNQNISFLRIVSFAGGLTAGAATFNFLGGAIFNASPVCVANDFTAPNAVQVTSTTTSSVTVAGTGTDGVRGLCFGN